MLQVGNDERVVQEVRKWLTSDNKVPSRLLTKPLCY